MVMTFRVLENSGLRIPGASLLGQANFVRRRLKYTASVHRRWLCIALRAPIILKWLLHLWEISEPLPKYEIILTT
jgi:hypothetical protein